MKTKSYGGLEIRSGRNCSTFRLITSTCSSRERVFAFSEIIRAALGFSSTKVTKPAPLESASSPNAPDPEKRSRIRESAIRICRLFIQDCLSLSEVGRVAVPERVLMRRPRWTPEVIFNTWPLCHGFKRDVNRFSVRESDLDQIANLS